MAELTELERLQKAVVDTAADYAAWDAAYDGWNPAYTAPYGAAYAAWSRAKQDLINYLK